MGKDDAYIVCGNAKCNPFPGTGTRSWRRIARGPDICKYCGTPFRVHTGALKEHGEAWLRQDSKGRARKVSFDEDSGKGPSRSAEPPHKPSPKPPPKSALRAAAADGDDLEAQFRARYKEDPEMLAKADEIWPPKPKTDSEIFLEAVAAVEQAEVHSRHMQKVANDMQVSLENKAKAFMEYKAKVAEKQQQFDAAKQELKDAQANLEALKANQSAPGVSAQAIDPSVVPIIHGLSGNYNPTQSLARALKDLPVVQTMDHTQASQFGGDMVALFQKHIHDFAAALLQAQSAPGTPAPPTPFLAVSSSATGGELQGGVGSGTVACALHSAETETRAEGQPKRSSQEAGLDDDVPTGMELHTIGNGVAGADTAADDDAKQLIDKAATAAAEIAARAADTRKGDGGQQSS